MDDDDLQHSIALHSAGATVQHSAPFSELVVPESGCNPPQDIINKWVLPFYMDRDLNSDKFWGRYERVRSELNVELCRDLLTWFNWRPRSVGALFAAIEGYDVLTEHIGHLLLRSDVCFAGRSYAIALARFGSPQAADYLVKYLDYYLTRRDLYFDQLDCMGALCFLDSKNGTTLAPPLMERCEEFYSDNGYIDCANSIEMTSELLSTLERRAPLLQMK